MKRYSVKFTGHMSLEAENKEEALGRISNELFEIFLQIFEGRSAHFVGLLLRVAGCIGLFII